jgi:uncharacterized protein (TIGR03083 family)
MPESPRAPYPHAYRELRARVADLARGAGGAFDGPSPATPAWRVHDVLSHLVGVTADVVHGRLEGVATDPWTAAQVDARRTDTAEQLLAEWEQHAAQFEAVLDSAPTDIAGQALFDAVTHEHDIRCALQSPGARDSEAVVIAWEWFVGARSRSGAQAIRYVIESGELIAGAGDPVVTVEAPRFELLRAAVGRRSIAEVERYGWDPEPNPTLLIAAPIFRMRDEPLDE